MLLLDRLVEQYDLSMQEALVEDPLFEDIMERVGKSPALKEKLMERTSILQVCCLEIFVYTYSSLFHFFVKQAGSY